MPLPDPQYNVRVEPRSSTAIAAGQSSYPDLSRKMHHQELRQLDRRPVEREIGKLKEFAVARTLDAESKARLEVKVDELLNALQGRTSDGRPL